jgi:hypothetical protein
MRTEEERRIAELLEAAAPHPPRAWTVDDVLGTGRSAGIARRRGRWLAPALAAAAAVVVVAAVAVVAAIGGNDPGGRAPATGGDQLRLAPQDVARELNTVLGGTATVTHLGGPTADGSVSAELVVDQGYGPVTLAITLSPAPPRPGSDEQACPAGPSNRLCGTLPDGTSYDAVRYPGAPGGPATGEATADRSDGLTVRLTEKGPVGFDELPLHEQQMVDLVTDPGWTTTTNGD